MTTTLPCLVEDARARVELLSACGVSEVEDTPENAPEFVWLRRLRPGRVVVAYRGPRHACRVLSVNDAAAAAYALKADMGPLERHPAYPAVSFVGSDEPAAARLLCEIGDPRWFRDPARPNRLNRLYEYLGLAPRYITVGGKGSPVTQNRRLQLVTQAWSGGTSFPNSPRGFLLRLRGTNRRGGLAACRAYVRFLSLVWLQALSPRSHVFCPETFFAGDEMSGVAAVFRAHLKSCPPPGV